MSDREAMQQALDALERNVQNKYPHQRSEAQQLGVAAITALRAALEQAEPVAEPHQLAAGVDNGQFMTQADE